MVLPHSIENRSTDLIQVTMRIQEITPHTEQKFLVNLGLTSLLVRLEHTPKLNPAASLLMLAA